MSTLHTYKAKKYTIRKKNLGNIHKTKQSQIVLTNKHNCSTLEAYTNKNSAVKFTNLNICKDTPPRQIKHSVTVASAIAKIPIDK